VPGHRERLAARVLEGDLTRVALGQLVDVRRPNLEFEPRLGQDRAPLRRGRREY